MQASELVQTIQDNKPVGGCDNCKALWVSLGEAYAFWYAATGDQMAQMLVEEKLAAYLAHRVTHEKIIAYVDESGKTKDGDTISFRLTDTEYDEVGHTVYWHVCGIDLTVQCDTIEHGKQLFDLLKTVKISDVD
jgi:hypothetical protein